MVRKSDRKILALDRLMPPCRHCVTFHSTNALLDIKADRSTADGDRSQPIDMMTFSVSSQDMHPTASSESRLPDGRVLDWTWETLANDPDDIALRESLIAT